MSKLEKVKELLQIFDKEQLFEFYYKKVYIIKVMKTEFCVHNNYRFILSDGSVIVIDLYEVDNENG